MISDYEDTISAIKYALEQQTIVRYGICNLDNRVDCNRQELSSYDIHMNVIRTVQMIESLPDHECALLIGLYGDPEHKTVCADVISKYMYKILSLGKDESYDIATMYFSMGAISEKKFADKYNIALGSVNRKKNSIFNHIDIWLESGLYKIQRYLRRMYNTYTII